MQNFFFFSLNFATIAVTHCSSAQSFLHAKIQLTVDIYIIFFFFRFVVCEDNRKMYELLLTQNVSFRGNLLKIVLLLVFVIGIGNKVKMHIIQSHHHCSIVDYLASLTQREAMHRSHFSSSLKSLKKIERKMFPESDALMWMWM